ncbi:MAG: hypothetical protein AAF570_18165, partial [Bacteroidota bacterium]
DNTVFAPQSEDLTHDPTYIQRVQDFLATKGNKILYIYGEYDTWGACGVTPDPRTNAVRLDLKKGSHRARIKHLKKRHQKIAARTLTEWVGEEFQIPAAIAR